MASFTKTVVFFFIHPHIFFFPIFLQKFPYPFGNLFSSVLVKHFGYILLFQSGHDIMNIIMVSQYIAESLIMFLQAGKA